MNYFSIDELPRTAWKNGGGTTREILCHPEGADLSGFDWRVSVATISKSGPFSRFEGIDRVIMLLEGDGVRLTGSVTSCSLDQHNRPFSFSGDEDIDCELLGGESTDFNVMTRRTVASAKINVIDDSTTVHIPEGGLVMVLSGSWSVDHQPVGPGQGYWWSENGREIRIEKNGAKADRLIVVRWARNQAGEPRSSG